MDKNLKKKVEKEPGIFAWKGLFLKKLYCGAASVGSEAQKS